MLFLVLLILAVLALYPLAAIWAINLLFGLTIAYTFKTWLAVVVLGGFIGSIGASATRRE